MIDQLHPQKKLELLLSRCLLHYRSQDPRTTLIDYRLLALALVLSQFQIQTLVNRYIFVAMLAAGGFGKTHIALDSHMPDPVVCVIKQLSPPSSDPQTVKICRKLFNTEAKTLQNLGNHPQIPQLLAYFEQDEEFYLVQEYIDGMTLHEELSQVNGLSETETIKILQDVLEVLARVHQAGTIHRDIKPANLIRRYSDRKIILIDFGAVKQTSTQIVNLQGAVSQTVVIGTPEYMPGEQSQGHPQYASDIYSLGLVGIQALIGKSPHKLERDAYGEWIWLSESEQKVNEKLASTLTKMVRVSLKERYTSAQEVLNDLQQLKPPIQQDNPGKNTRLQTRQEIKPPKSKLGLPIALALTGAIILGGVTFLLFPKRESIILESYQNNNVGIKLKYPINWTVQEDTISNEISISSQGNTPPNNLIIVIEPLNNPKLTLEEYTQNRVNYLNTNQTLGTITVSKTKLDERDARQITYQEKLDETPFQVKETITLIENKVYTIISKIDQQQSAEYNKVLPEIIKSFEIVKPPTNG